MEDRREVMTGDDDPGAAVIAVPAPGSARPDQSRGAEDAWDVSAESRARAKSSAGRASASASRQTAA